MKSQFAMARPSSAEITTLRRLRVVPVLLGALVLPVCGCSLMDPLKPKPPPPPAVRTIAPPAQRSDGAIYQSGQDLDLFADLKARRVGDLLTIHLTEATTATKDATTKTSKTTSLVNTGPQLFGHTITNNGVPILDASLNGAHSFDGAGSSAQSNSLAGSISVTVTEVQPNGNLVIEGQKALRLNQGDEVVRIAGVVRPADIAVDNSVTSDRIAEARIAYSGRGVVNSSNSMGWLARFFNSPVAPF